jgi:UDP-glucose 4-epimerase
MISYLVVFLRVVVVRSPIVEASLVVLVTGGTGFIGSRVTRRLIADERSVVCFDLEPEPARLRDAAGHPKLRIVKGDIRRLDHVVRAVQQYGVKHIIHTAAVLSQVCQADPRTGLDVNVMGTANVFEAARLSGVERVVYASSMVVLGSQWDHGDHLLDENAPLRPATFYAHTKVMNEHTARAYTEAFGLDCRGLRIGSPYGSEGKYGRPGTEVTRMLSLTAVGEPILVMLGTQESPPVTYVEDVVEIFVRLCDATTLTRPVYLCSVDTLSVSDVADKIRRLIPDARITFEDPGQRVTLPYRIDTRALEADIGYRLPPLETRLRDHINEIRVAAGLPIVPARG